ncbi:MAG: hypothetical protein AAF958_20300, partial [Planctomycetota bacterium]
MAPPRRTSFAGFRRAVLRGLGVALPPLLTIVVLIWAWNSIDNYVLQPIETGVRQIIVWGIEDTYSEVPLNARPTNGKNSLDGFIVNNRRFVPDSTGRRFFPETVKKTVDDQLDSFGLTATTPVTANAYWHRFVQ